MIYTCFDLQCHFILYEIKHLMNSYKYQYPVQQTHLFFVLFSYHVSLEAKLSVENE